MKTRYNHKVLQILFFIGIALSACAMENNIKTCELNAQSTISDFERQAKIDSITAEIERQFGWNDTAYAPEIAYRKWNNGEASFLLQGGIAPSVYIGQENFKKNYGVDYEDFGCMAYCSEHQMKIYNTVIMDCLTAKYGNKWIDDVSMGHETKRIVGEVAGVEGKC